MKYLLIILGIIIISAVVYKLKAQPKSTYQIIVDANPEIVNYKYFSWEGADSSGNRLLDGMDYLAPDNVSDLVFSESSGLTMIKEVDNNGEYICFGVVGFNPDGYYSAMGTSGVFKKGKVPGKPTIQIQKIK